MFRVLLNYLAAALCLATLAGCVASSGHPGLNIDGLIFRNQTGGIVHNVQAQVKKTSAFAECSPILAGKECTTTFRPVLYQGNAITISWEQNGQAFRADDLHASLPAPLIDGKNARVVVIISRAGRADVRLTQ